jgi:endonuclease III
MKDGTKYAARLKSAYAKLRKEFGPIELVEVENPLHQLAIAVLGPTVADQRARRAVDRIVEKMVDWNEIRVSTPAQVQEAIGITGDGVRDRCRALVRCLQAIYDRENQVTLDHLKKMPRREARQYLDELDGLGDYAVASVFLWSLGGHAIPLHADLFTALQAEELVHPEADAKTVQAFLERNVAAAEAREFTVVIQALCDRTRPKSTRARKAGGVKKSATPKTRKRRSKSSRTTAE